MERRVLDFTKIEDIMTDVESLLNGHLVVGTWSLPQILSHLAKSVRLASRTFAPGSDIPNPTPEEELLLARVFETRALPTGLELPNSLLAPKSEIELSEAVTALRAALEKLQKAIGPFAPHPYLGRMSREAWLQFHCIHCSHHLSFAIPFS